MSDEIRLSPRGDGTEEDCQCARCGSSCGFESCDNCEDGFSGHECGDDSCCCRYPEDNVICDVCGGSEGWYRCLSSAEWCEAHPIAGREAIERGAIEWFDVSPTLPVKDPLLRYVSPSGRSTRQELKP